MFLGFDVHKEIDFLKDSICQINRNGRGILSMGIKMNFKTVFQICMPDEDEIFRIRLRKQIKRELIKEVLECQI